MSHTQTDREEILKSLTRYVIYKLFRDVLHKRALQHLSENDYCLTDTDFHKKKVNGL